MVCEFTFPPDWYVCMQCMYVYIHASIRIFSRGKEHSNTRSIHNIHSTCLKLLFQSLACTPTQKNKKSTSDTYEPEASTYIHTLMGKTNMIKKNKSTSMYMCRSGMHVRICACIHVPANLCWHGTKRPVRRKNVTKQGRNFQSWS